jgi:hypothetical protein
MLFWLVDVKDTDLFFVVVAEISSRERFAFEWNKKKTISLNSTDEHKNYLRLNRVRNS